MPVNYEELEQKVLSALNERTLVNGTAVATAPIARETGITPDQLERALENLAQKGSIRRAPGALATITPDGHARQM